MTIESIKSRSDLEKALKRVEELWESEPDTPEGNELKLLVGIIETYEEDLLSDDKLWDSFFNGKPAKDFPLERGSQYQRERDDFD